MSNFADTPDTKTPAVAQLDRVSHRYGKVLALDDVTLHLPARQMVGLIGPDGVGKFTLMALVAGAKKLQTGEVKTLGGDMTSARHRANAGRHIAFMPQGPGRNLYHDLSIQENPDFFGKLFGLNHADRAARIQGLTQAPGLAPFMERLAGKLSGGG